MSGPRDLRHSLDRLSRGLGGPQATALAGLFARWEQIVGPEVAAHTCPVSLVGGVLVVAVDEPGWATRLRYGEADLRAVLEDALGAGCVRRLDVRVRPR